MVKQAFSRSLGWFTLGALVALGPELSGCGETTKEAVGTEEFSSPAPLPQASPAQPSTTLPQPSTQPSTAEGVNTLALSPSESKKALSSEASALPRVQRLVVARDVKDREPVDAGGMTVSEPVVAFLEMKHLGSDEAALVVTFEHEGGKKVGFIELSVPGESPRFRTWGRTRNIKDSGSWVAVVTTKDGVELARQEFTVEG